MKDTRARCRKIDRKWYIDIFLLNLRGVNDAGFTYAIAIYY